MPFLASSRNHLGLIPSQENKKKSPGRDINRLLNRLLGVHIEDQKKIFNYFMLLLVRDTGTGTGEGALPC